MSVAAELHHAAASESEAARLFEEHSDRVFGYCLRRVGSRSDAEDAVQTTFLYALRALQRGVEPECESAWLTTIAKNVCHWQRRTLDRRGSLTSDVDLDSIAHERYVDDDGQELCQDLTEALASIPESQRRALVLREWHGLSSSEVAAQLGMSPPATYALLTRARHSLAQALSGLPRRPVLGLHLGWLFFRLRGLLAGTAAKAVATTVVVAGVAIGGVSVEKALGEERSAPPMPAPGLADADAGAQAGTAGRAASASSAPSRHLRAEITGDPSSPSRDGTNNDALPGGEDSPTGPTTEGGGPSEAPADTGGVTDPVAELLPGVSLEPLPLPDVGLPELSPPDGTLPLPPPPDPTVDGLPPVPAPPPVPDVELPDLPL